MNIRAATSADLDHLVQIEESASRLYRLHGFPPRDATPRNRNELEHLLQTTRLQVMADISGSIVGYLSCYAVTPWFHLEEIGVNLTLQGQGIGSQLIEDYLRAGQRQDAILGYTLTVYRKADWAVYLYQKYGFRPCDKHTNLPAPHVLERLMEQDRQAGLDPLSRVLMVKMK